MARIRVVLDDVHFSGMHYFDWLATGLWALEDQGEIEADVRVTATTSLFRQNSKLITAGRRLVPNLMRSLERGWHTIITGKVTDGSRSTSFVMDAGDSPYAFDTSLLVGSDLYFKAQLPTTLDPAGFPIAEGARFPYHPDVLTFQDRIRPAMLGRPLSRRLHRRDNAKILAGWERRAQAPKDNALLAYFGTDSDVFGGPEAEVMTRFAGRVAHPNVKRGQLVDLLQTRLPGQSDARVLNSKIASRVRPSLSDATFNDLVGRSWHNINVSGFRRSAPFRFIDAFLVGASVPTDEMAVRWYAPWQEGVEIIELGKMGYELDAAVNWAPIGAVLEGLAAESEATRRERQRAVLDAYRRQWQPSAFARYLVRTCTERW